MKLSGNKLAGGNPQRGRVDNDFYATPEVATEALMKVEKFNGKIWECACGDGRMSKILEKYNQTISSDLYDRGYGTPNIDFLKIKNKIYDNIITNPPFEFFQDFAENALLIAKYKVALFGKLQALEGQKRATFLENSPLKVVYVFKKRVNPLRNGLAINENGKKWASTMAFAWYVWEIGHNCPPIIKWL